MCVVDRWRKKAYDTFINTEWDYVKKRAATYDMLEREYPDSYWSVFASRQINGHGNREDDVLSTKSNGDAMERGWEEEEIWKNIPMRDLLGEEFLYTLYIWRALSSHYDSKLRTATDERTKKVEQIIYRLKEKEKRELDSFSDEEKKKRWSCERLRDELLQQMNDTPQLMKWKHIIVSIYSLCYSTVVCSVFYSFPGHKIFVCFQS